MIRVDRGRAGRTNRSPPRAENEQLPRHRGVPHRHYDAAGLFRYGGGRHQLSSARKWMSSGYVSGDVDIELRVEPLVERWGKR